MIKHFCDKCGKEIKKPIEDIFNEVKFKFFENDPVCKELCDPCQKEFSKWMKK